MSGRTGIWLQFCGVAILCGGFVAPIALGFWETLLPAFGILPAIGADTFSLNAWTALAALPGVWTSLRLTVFTGLLSTLLSLGLAVAFCASVHGRVGARRAERMLSPLLAVPHAAMAIGAAFLIAPSGWLARLFSPWATTWGAPPAITTVHDAAGLSLVFGLVVKEVPFLLLVIIAALNQISARQQLAAGRALGYGHGVIWIKIIFPQVYRQIRLPVYAVLAFALSVVDMAIILGPSNPPVLSVAAMRWFMSADVDLLLPAAAASILQIAVVVAGISGWWLGEKLVAAAGRAVIRRGGRGLESEPLIRFATVCVLALLAAGFAAILSLIVWSFTWRWSFPDALPSSFTTSIWVRSASGWLHALANTAGLGFGSTLLSLLLAILWLEGEDRSGRRLLPGAPVILYLPLLLPQIGFLYGLQVTFLRAGIDGSPTTVLWGHTLFVFPYVMLALSDPWRALDRRYVRTAAALGASPLRTLFRLKLPLLLRPLLAATAIGFAVSAAQYLPTLFLGAGRIATLTTEAVTLSSGGDRRIIGVYAALQALVPLLVYGVAFALPGMVYADRRELNGVTV
ncbi:ABC transporter permease [Ciceribacter thiooxidans]|uniref:ABC transporter permease n=2 Tax=Ciceribacter thiooxidans TaxID=1969821 RepID=A0ABV7I5R9_9HYPH|nr:ABC transporter permease [Ciceribacter thiooxidans]